MLRDLLTHIGTGMAGAATTTATIGVLEGQRRAAASLRRWRVYGDDFFFVFFFCWCLWIETSGSKPANACKGRTSIKALLRPNLY
jgi:hypothetical protein